MTCNHDKTIFIETPNLVHYGKNECADCGRWIEWVSNPDKDGRTRTSRHTLEQIASHRGHPEPRCFFCWRPQEYLGNNQTLTRDHIHELQDGGKDTIENLQILCSACHKLKNHQKLYYHDHLIDLYQDNTNGDEER